MLKVLIIFLISIMWCFHTLKCDTVDNQRKEMLLKKINIYNIQIPKELHSDADIDLNLSALSSSPSTIPKCTKEHRLSRQKRFLAFPLGSSFSAAVCMSTGVLGNPNYQYLSFGLNWGLAYDLPNVTWILNQAHGIGIKENDTELIEMVEMPAINRRHRRELYRKVETLIDGMGYNGRDCVLRTLCESRKYLGNSKISMIGEMLRTIFRLPKHHVLTRELREDTDIKQYDQVYRYAHQINDCAQQYSCEFSLFELAFGKYSTPPADYYRHH